MHFQTQLRHEHDLLLVAAEELKALCPERRPDDLTPLLIVLERFNQLLQIHLLREDSVLYPAILAAKDPEAAAVAAKFQAELGCLDAHLAGFDERWLTNRISSEWRSFRDEMGALLEALRLRVERENAELLPLYGACVDLAA